MAEPKISEEDQIAIQLLAHHVHNLDHMVQAHQIARSVCLDTDGNVCQPSSPKVIEAAETAFIETATLITEITRKVRTRHVVLPAGLN